jgi:DHA2 family multidrug resistance protein
LVTTARLAPPPPLTGLRLVAGTVVLSAATFMNVLDVSIANVSIPAIAGDLGVAPNQGTWVITSFAVANGISVPLTGWLAQRFGAVRLFTTSVLLFTFVSWLCGMAPSIGTLIFFRVLQGAVAGPMIPLSQSLLLASYPKEKSGTALAMWSITSLVAPIVGPVLGGWITDNINWAWIFYINVPVGLIAASASWLLYHKRETPTHRRPVDAIGLALLILWIGAFQVMLDKGKELDWFESRQIVALALVAGVGFLFFLAWELTEEHPVVDLSLFGNRNFWTATLTISTGYSMYFGNIVLLPLWLQQFMGYTPTLAGVALAPMGLLAMVLSPMVGKSVARVDPRFYGSLGFAIFAVVLWMRSNFSTDADFVTILWPTVVQGAAIALFFIPLFNLALSGIPPEKIPSASGLVNFVRITGGAFGASVATTMWERRTILHHARLVEHIERSDLVAHADLGALRSAVASPEQGLAAVNRLVDQQAAMMAANDIFAACAVLFVLLMVIIWFARPERLIAPSQDAGGAH